MTNYANAAISCDTEKQEKHSVEDLPFFKAGHKQPFWQVKTTGDYKQDCALGEHYAVLALEYMFTAKFTPLLCWITRDMAHDPESNAIQIGFMSKIAEYTLLTTGIKGERDLKKTKLFLVKNKPSSDGSKVK